jgi:hypothetical protein
MEQVYGKDGSSTSSIELKDKGKKSKVKFVMPKGIFTARLSLGAPTHFN